MTILEWMRLPKDEWKPATAVFGWMHPDRETAMEIERQIKALESQNAALVREAGELRKALVKIKDQILNDYQIQDQPQIEGHPMVWWIEQKLIQPSPAEGEKDVCGCAEPWTKGICHRVGLPCYVDENPTGAPPAKERDEDEALERLLKALDRFGKNYGEFGMITDAEFFDDLFTAETNYWKIRVQQGKTV